MVSRLMKMITEMSWNKEGNTVRAEYCGVVFDGVVVESRVKYGGKVQHTVVASEPFYLDWSDEPRTQVLVDDNDILIDFGVLESE